MGVAQQQMARSIPPVSAPMFLQTTPSLPSTSPHSVTSPIPTSIPLNLASGPLPPPPPQADAALLPPPPPPPGALLLKQKSKVGPAPKTASQLRQEIQLFICTILIGHLVGWYLCHLANEVKDGKVQAKVVDLWMKYFADKLSVLELLAGEYSFLIGHFWSKRAS